jgi:hypothetical protein
MRDQIYTHTKQHTEIIVFYALMCSLYKAEIFELHGGKNSPDLIYFSTKMLYICIFIYVFIYLVLIQSVRFFKVGLDFFFHKTHKYHNYQTITVFQDTDTVCHCHGKVLMLAAVWKEVG